jgi:hypothetical protein
VPKTIGAAWNGNFDIHLEFMPVESAGADNLNWKATMEAFGAKTDPRDSFAQAGYLAARIATEALLKMDPKKIDRASVSTALRNVKSFKSDILCRPFYVGDGVHHTGADGLRAGHACCSAGARCGRVGRRPCVTSQRSCMEVTSHEGADVGVETHRGRVRRRQVIRNKTGERHEDNTFECAGYAVPGALGCHCSSGLRRRRV